MMSFSATIRRSGDLAALDMLQRLSGFLRERDEQEAQRLAMLLHLFINKELERLK